MPMLELHACAPSHMSQPTSSTVTTRQYRMAHAILTLGVLAAGMLMLESLITRFHDGLLMFYGISEADFRVGDHVAGLSMSIGQFFVAVIGIIGIIGFIINERVVLSRRAAEGTAERVVVTKLPIDVVARTYVKRCIVFSDVLLTGWLLQASYINMREGFGWGLGFSGWKSVLPIMLIFGFCIGVGLIAAAISMLGLRAIQLLEAMIHGIVRCTVHRAQRVVWQEGIDSPTARQRFGLDILSRPPPMCAV